jgi:hypothetical protein
MRLPKNFQPVGTSNKGRLDAAAKCGKREGRKERKGVSLENKIKLPARRHLEKRQVRRSCQVEKEEKKEGKKVCES